MRKQFEITKSQMVGEMTVNALQDYLKKYISLQYPDSGIDYWSGQIEGLDKLLPARGSDDNTYHHTAAYARDGHSEGRIIELRLILRDGSTQEIARAKSFGNAAECWDIAQSMSDVVDGLYCFDELPMAVDFAAHLPMKPDRIKMDGDYRQHTLGLEIDALGVNVMFDNALIDRITVPDDHAELYKQYYINAAVQDWERIATNLDMLVSKSKIEAVPVTEDEEDDSCCFSPS